jgi:hypothetical protein
LGCRNRFRGITRIVLWSGAKDFGRWAVVIGYVLHDISAFVMLGGVFVHVYPSTIGEPGTGSGVIRGAASRQLQTLMF